MQNSVPSQEPGLYRPGTTWLHRLDVRAKFLLLPALVVAVFSAGPMALGLLGVLGILLACSIGAGAEVLARSLRPVRWLLLATLLLHLLLTPGRVLPGVSWLSYDGLLLGIFNCSQLLLAMCFANLLALTTEPGDIPAAIYSLLSPLRRCGLSVERLAELLTLTLHFVPILREEGMTAWKHSAPALGTLRRGPLLDRARGAAGLLEPLVVRLADRADELAGRMAVGEPVAEARVLGPMSLRACLLLLSAILLLVVVEAL